MIQASRELFNFLDRRSRAFSRQMVKLADAYGDPGKWDEGIRELGGLIQETMVLSDLHGRKRMLMEGDYVRRHNGRRGAGQFAADESVTPSIPFEEAIDDLVSREPRLARSAPEVSRLYSTSHSFAMAKASSLRLSDRIKEIIAESMRAAEGAGKTIPEIQKAAAEDAHNWAAAYSGTVYRTNVNTAYTAGRFAQARDPDVQDVIPAMEFVSARMPTSRPNHEAAHGLIAAVDDPIWSAFKPPVGYNCYCAANFVSIFDLERRGLVHNGRVVRYEPPMFRQAYPDPGFKGGAF